MVSISSSFTAPVNNPSTFPSLSRAQLWTALQLKLRAPQDFIPSVAYAEVHSESNTHDGSDSDTLIIERTLHFKESHALPGGRDNNVSPSDSPRSLREVVRCHKPTCIEFRGPGGGVNLNLVTEGEGGLLYLTYVFEFRFEGVEKGSKEYAEKEEEVRDFARASVLASLEVARRFVEEGKI